MIPLGTVIFLAFIGVVIAIAWPTCETEASRWWLVGTMATIPWLAWLYWIPRRVRYELAKHRHRSVKQRGTLISERAESVRFWTQCQHSGSPIERVVASQMLAFFAELPFPLRTERTFAAELHQGALRGERP